MSCRPAVHRNRRSRSVRPSESRGLIKSHSRSCGLTAAAKEALEESAAVSLQPYVIRGGQRVRCRCGKRDGLQDDTEERLPPREKDCLNDSPDDIKMTSPADGDPSRVPVADLPPLPVKDPHLLSVGGQSQLPDVCPLCRSQTYNLPNLLCVREPGRLAPEARPPTPPLPLPLPLPLGEAPCAVALVPAGPVLGQAPSAEVPSHGAVALPGTVCPCPRSWQQVHRQAAVGCLCQRGQEDAGRGVQGHARRLQCCGEAAAKMAEQIEKSLQDAHALAVKSNAKQEPRRRLSRGTTARRSEKRSASVSLEAPLNRLPKGCFKRFHESELASPTFGTPVYPAKIQNNLTAVPEINQLSASSSEEIHTLGSMNHTKDMLETRYSDRSQKRHSHVSPTYTAAGDENTSLGLRYLPQCKYNWWYLSQPGERHSDETEMLMSPYSVVCPHHPQWHSFYKCIHRIPLALQTPVTSNKSVEEDNGISTISPFSNQDLQIEGETLLTETNKSKIREIQQSTRKLDDIVSKDVGKLETSKKALCCKAREMSTQTLISCVKLPPGEGNDRTIFASRGVLYGKVEDSFQVINPVKRDSGTQTILTAARISASADLGSSCTASKGTVCGSFVRSIGPINSTKSVSGSQSICPIVRKLIPSRAQSVKISASQGTACSRSERVIESVRRPEGREIATQAGGTILQQLRGSKSLDVTNSVQRPISRPRSLSSSSSPCSSVVDNPTTHQNGMTFPLLSRPEDMLELPYFSWPSTFKPPSRETLRDRKIGFQHGIDDPELDDGEELIENATSVTSTSVECKTPKSDELQGETISRVSTTSMYNRPRNIQPVGSEEPPVQRVVGCKANAANAKARRENAREHRLLAPVRKALQPKLLTTESEGQAESTKVAASNGPLHRPPSKRPLETHVPAPTGHCTQRGTKQKLRTNTNQPDVPSKPNS